MASDPEGGFGCSKMRANRKVVETRCSTCSGEFALGEEVYSCPNCGGYHHVDCLAREERCGQTPQSGPAEAAEVSAAAAAPELVAPQVEEPPEVRRRKQDLAATYAGWETERLEYELTQQRNQYDPIAVEVMTGELDLRSRTCPKCQRSNPPGTLACECGHDFQIRRAAPAPESAGGPPLAPDERKCPTCAEVIKKEALKCRYCGQVLKGDVVGGNLFGVNLSVDVPIEITRKIESKATTALVCGILGPVCMFIPGIIALVNGHGALRMLEENPAYKGRTSARGRALAGLIIAYIWLGLVVVGLIIKLSQS